MCQTLFLQKVCTFKQDTMSYAQFKRRLGLFGLFHIMYAFMRFMDHFSVCKDDWKYISVCHATQKAATQRRSVSCIVIYVHSNVRMSTI